MTSPEVRLFRAVITQAFLDACWVPPPQKESKKISLKNARRTESRIRQHIVDRDHARAWLTRPSRDFFHVCNYAGWDHQYIRRRAYELAARGWEQATSGEKEKLLAA